MIISAILSKDSLEPILWIARAMDARALGALNTTIKLLLDMRQWLNPEISEQVLEYPDEEQEDSVEKESHAG